MPEKSYPKLASGQVVKWKELDYPSVYANVIGIGLTPFDINLIFGEIGESTPTELSGIPKVKILLAPEQAANLMKLLSLVLETYREGNGQLRTAGAVDVDNIQAQLNARKIKYGQ